MWNRLAAATAYYEVRIIFGITSILPMLGLPLAAFVLWLTWSRNNAPSPQLVDLLRAFEMVLPLSAGLSAAHLMTVERDEGFDELRRTYPESPWRVPLLRAGGAVFLALVSLIAGAISFRMVYGPFDAADIIVPALPPALFLLGLSLLVGNLTGSYWLAAAAAMGYWFFEMQTRGYVTRAFALFDASWPYPDVNYHLNRGLLVAAGLALIAANGYISALRRRNPDLWRLIAWSQTKRSTGG